VTDARPGALTRDEIDGLPSELPEWEVLDDRIRREITTSDFVSAFGLMAQVAIHAQVLDHHPEWSNVYNRVTIELTTHDIGGLSGLDVELARRIDGVARQFA
jgi:4a-hydroxytetrahydrobiopterin dehydratase